MSLLICLDRWLESSPHLIAFVRSPRFQDFVSPLFVLYCFAFCVWWARERRLGAFFVFLLAETLLVAVGLFVCPPRPDWLQRLSMLTTAVWAAMWVVPWVMLLRLPRRRRFYLISERV